MKRQITHAVLAVATALSVPAFGHEPADPQGQHEAEGQQAGESLDKIELVRATQRALNARGYAAGSLGDWGLRAKQALLRFQQSQGLDPSGKINQATLVALGIVAPEGGREQTASAADRLPDPAYLRVTPEAEQARSRSRGQ